MNEIDNTKRGPRFHKPGDYVNYADYSYVGSHNAHTYAPFFNAVCQQDGNITTQLDFGIRGLMLDTYNWKLTWSLITPYSKKGEGKVVLSHGEPGSALTDLQKVGFQYQTLRYEIVKIIKWLKTNPSEIVTIILEDYANSSDTSADIADATKEAGYDPIFKPGEWTKGKTTIIGPDGKTYTAATLWPSLGWMRSTNNRLIIFTQRAGNTSHTWNQFSHCIENQYSTIQNDQLCQERAESKGRGSNRQLVIFNNFPADPISSMFAPQISYNESETIKFCRQKNFASGRKPNGYFADHIMRGVTAIEMSSALVGEPGKITIFDYINELNAGKW